MSGCVELLADKKYLYICRRISNSHIFRDLYQDTVETILNKSYDICSLNRDNQLNHFFAGMAWKTYHSNKWRKQYGFNHYSYELIENKDSVVEEEYDFTEDQKVDAVLKEFGKKKKTEKDKYLHLLFKRYLQCDQSGYAVSSTYNIPPRTVFHGIDQIKKKYQYVYEAASKGR